MSWGDWTAKQRNMLRREAKAGNTIAYWCSDAHGRSANGGQLIQPAAPGVVHRQSVAGAVSPCGPKAVHATFEPHRWAGVRVWIVSMRGGIVQDKHKLAAAERLIIGEVLPEWAPDASCGVRVGRRDLRGANLRGANLYGADLYSADLRGANLYGANLRGANLYGANLRGANLRGANLRVANLYSANLRGANLRGANLYSADLVGADLRVANLYSANLGGWERGPNGYAKRKEP